MAGRPGQRSRPLAVATAAGLLALLAGSAVAGPLPDAPPRPVAPAALPPGSVETPGRNELVSTPQVDGGALGVYAIGIRAIGQADDIFGPPTISADGRFVVFLQQPNVDDRNSNEVVVRDRKTGKTTVMAESDSNGPLREPTISADGQWVAFVRSMDGPQPTSVILVERASGSPVPLPRLPRGYYWPDQPALSGNGNVLVVRVQTSQEGTEILLLDRTATQGAWEPVSVDVNNEPTGSTSARAAQPAISWDGLWVAFSALGVVPFSREVRAGSDFRQVYLRDRSAGTTRLVSITPDNGPGRGDSMNPAISGDGNVVAFPTAALDLDPDIGTEQYHVVAWSRATERVELVSRASDGASGNGASAYAAVNGDGSQIAFASAATNLVPGDTTDGPPVPYSPRAGFKSLIAGDIFIRDRTAARTSRVSAARGNESEANGLSLFPSISGTGRYVAFTSVATNLIANDRNGTAPDVFVRDRPPRVEAGPNPVDFGSAVLGSLGTTRPVTIRSTGVTPAKIGEISRGGANADDFVVAANPCTGQTLAPGATCEVLVLFVGTAQGDRKATLQIASDAGDPIALRLVATVGKARLKVEPPQGPAGLVVIATGTGFPPNAPIALTWSTGITAAPLVPVVSDGSGSFTAQVLILPHQREGERNLRAVPSVPGVKVKAVTAPFLLVPSTASPPTSGLVQMFATTEGEPIILRR